MGDLNIFNIVSTDLLNERIQLEAELERAVNLNIPIPEKIILIKVALKNLAVHDLMISKWDSYLPDNEDEK